jgi:glutathione synthase/RimK-type ligase-like ATP-grasp enzyme
LAPTLPIVHDLSDKEQMYFLPKKHNNPTPETVFPKSKTDVLEFLDRVAFPVMLKGIDGMRLWKRTGRKMFIVWDAMSYWKGMTLLRIPNFRTL